MKIDLENMLARWEKDNERWALRAWYYQSSSDAEKEGKRHRCRGTLGKCLWQGNERGERLKGWKEEFDLRALYKYLIWPINNQPYVSIADLPHPVLPHCPYANIPNVSVVMYLILSLFKSTRSLSTAHTRC